MQIYPQTIIQQVQAALEEDRAHQDISAALLPKTHTTQAKIYARSITMLCGVAWCEEAIAQLDSDASFHWHYNEGDTLSKDALVVEITAKSHSLLSGERVSLNFLQLMSGVAWAGKQCIAKGIDVMDTRKSLPNLRALQKYALAISGIKLHRSNLNEMFLLKENHIACLGGIATAVSAAIAQDSSKLIEIEVENIQQLHQALATQANIIMLDNFSLQQIQEAIKINQNHPNKKLLEVSGNIQACDIEQLANLGVDRVSLGTLSKDIVAADYSMLIDID